MWMRWGMMALLVIMLAFTELHAQPTGPALPGVPDEPSEEMTLTEDEAGTTSLASEELPVMSGGTTEASQSFEDYQNAIRQAFASHEYSKVIELSDEVEQFYPERKMLDYYRVTAQQRLTDISNKENRPYRSLRDKRPEFRSEEEKKAELSLNPDASEIDVTATTPATAPDTPTESTPESAVSTSPAPPVETAPPALGERGKLWLIVIGVVVLLLVALGWKAKSKSSDAASTADKSQDSLTSEEIEEASTHSSIVAEVGDDVFTPFDAESNKAKKAEPEEQQEVASVEANEVEDDFDQDDPFGLPMGGDDSSDGVLDEQEKDPVSSAADKAFSEKKEEENADDEEVVEAEAISVDDDSMIAYRKAMEEEDVGGGAELSIDEAPHINLDAFADEETGEDDLSGDDDQSAISMPDLGDDSEDDDSLIQLDAVAEGDPETDDTETFFPAIDDSAPPEQAHTDEAYEEILAADESLDDFPEDEEDIHEARTVGIAPEEESDADIEASGETSVPPPVMQSSEAGPSDEPDESGVIRFEEKSLDEQDFGVSEVSEEDAEDARGEATQVSTPLGDGQTKTGWEEQEDAGAQGKPAGSKANDPDDLEATGSVQSFKGEDTVRIDWNKGASQAGKAPSDATEVSADGDDYDTLPQIDTSVPDQEASVTGAGEDLYMREFNKGKDAFEAGSWDNAVHHLSVAAALRPDASEVKDKLREARAQRKASMEQA